MGNRIEDFPPDMQRQIAMQLAAGKIATTAPYIAPMPSSESTLQSQCENVLRDRGYIGPGPISHRAILTAAGARGIVGFFVHLHQPQGNPQLPDLLIYDYPLRRPPLLVELKVRDEFSPGQKDAITAGLWKLAYCVEEFDALLMKWEAL
jgi:hypothetical protein